VSQTQAFDYRADDRQVWEEDLDSFVPKRVYDTHIHLFKKSEIAPAALAEVHFEDADFNRLKAWTSTIMPGREAHFLVLGTPSKGSNTKAHNDMMFNEVRADPLSRMNRLTTPACTPEDIERDFRRGFVGLKVYRIYATSGNAKDCRIHEFLTEPQMEVANQLGMWVTLHLSREMGCGDEENLKDLENYTKKYPRIKWILAHSARSFIWKPIRLAIDRLRAMPNIYYDLSAVCEVRAFTTLFQQEDHRRIFYGSDGIDSTGYHGYYVPFGHAWQQVKTDKLTMHPLTTNRRPILCIYEQLLAMKHAAEYAGYTKDQIEDIFWRNAVKALKVDWK